MVIFKGRNEFDPDFKNTPGLKICPRKKSLGEKKAWKKKKPGGKNEQKNFFSGISLEPWGNDRLWSNFYKEGLQAISQSNR